MRSTLIRLALAGALSAQLPSLAYGADADGFLAERCGSCHQLAPPAAPSLAERMQRKGPPLFYAGNKFRRDWLVAWLQQPVRIRPAGDFPPAHIKSGPKGDEVDKASLLDHPALPLEQAEMAAGLLAKKTPNTALIEAESFEPVRISKRMGEMDFVKFKGCGACHRDTPQYGGVSGPELYTAWQRLTPEFITSFIRNPAAWEPRSQMVNLHLQAEAINKLASYLKLIGEEEGGSQ